MPEHLKNEITEFHDALCSVLTDWECGVISDMELYSFMCDLSNTIETIEYY